MVFSASDDNTKYRTRMKRRQPDRSIAVSGWKSPEALTRFHDYPQTDGYRCFQNLP